jgi:hypothetical protein
LIEDIKKKYVKMGRTPGSISKMNAKYLSVSLRFIKSQGQGVQPSANGEIETFVGVAQLQ